MPSPIDSLAIAVLERYGIAPQPPIDVRVLAQRMGVDEIETIEMVEDARLEYRPDFVRIALKQGMPESRHRFTLAHELGHLLLAAPESPLIARRFRPHESREERFCDAFAAAVLLPECWMHLQAGRQPASLATVRKIADESGTSLAAATVRLRDVIGWTSSLLRWRLISGQWRFAAGAGVPRRLHGHIRSTPQTTHAIERARRHRSIGIPTTLPLFLAEAECDISVELMVFRETAIALADLRST